RTISLGSGHRVQYPAPTTLAASAVMGGNHKRDTAPELAVRKALYARGLRYRGNPFLPTGSGLHVRPDVPFFSDRIALFIDGCFWNGCPEHGTRPRVNVNYWRPKIDGNRARDRRNTATLKQEGWVVIRVWEHEPAQKVAQGVVEALRSRRSA